MGAKQSNGRVRRCFFRPFGDGLFFFPLDPRLDEVTEDEIKGWFADPIGLA